MPEQRRGSHDKYRSERCVTGLGDAAVSHSPTSGMIPRCQTYPGGKISARSEAFGRWRFHAKHRRPDWSYPGNCRDAPASLILAMPFHEPRIAERIYEQQRFRQRQRRVTGRRTLTYPCQCELVGSSSISPRFCGFGLTTIAQVGRGAVHTSTRGKGRTAHGGRSATDTPADRDGRTCFPVVQGPCRRGDGQAAGDPR